MLGYRAGYDPPLLALEWTSPKTGDAVLRKDIPFPEAGYLASLVAEVDDALCAAAVLDDLVSKNAAFLDFDKYFSKKQVLRLVDMVLQGGPDSVEG